jgi:hypothetical protein
VVVRAAKDQVAAEAAAWGVDARMALAAEQLLQVTYAFAVSAVMKNPINAAFPV